MEEMQKLIDLRNDFLKDIEEISNRVDLENFRVKYFGKKSILSDLMNILRDASSDKKPILGKEINSLKIELKNLFDEKKNSLSKNLDECNTFDKTIKGNEFFISNFHPITLVMNEAIEVFKSLGFSLAYGPDIEADYYNFSALNFPDEHPARDMQDTFFLDDYDENKKNFLLRTHTSPVQVRYMKYHKPPFQIISPGNVYRCDSDISHTPMFHQIEGLAISNDISFANLKWILTEFIHRIFGYDINTRFRPSFFPFTEPSVEVDMSCVICHGKGCRVCKDTGWVEILGAGMVHPNVLKNVSISPDEYQGFAFGMGIERIAMIKYGIDDIRLFFENDIRFLKKFC